MIRLWGRLSSINVQKVVWCLDELELAYQRVDAGGAFGIVATPEYLAMNPNGLIPVVEHDGFVLWESNAIVRYLAASRPEAGLWPAEPRARADCDRWMDWQSTTATPAMRDLFWQLIRTPEPDRDEAAVARSRAASERVARMLDSHLADRPYMVGASFTAADIAVGAHAHRWLRLPIARPDLPHLGAWCEQLRARPAAAAAMAVALT